MSDITTTSNLDIAALFAMAEEMGIDLADSPSISEGGGRFTPFSIPKGNRFSVTYFDTGKFEWNAPDQDADFKESFYKFVDGEAIDITDFNVIKGYIVGFELQPRLSSYVENKTKVSCSCIGYMNNGEYIKALPPVPIKSMHSWVGDSISYTTPDPLVTKFDLVGSRGETCTNCIRNGHSIMEVETDKGTKTEVCGTRGVLYMVVTELGKSTMKAGKKGEDPEEVIKTYNVSDITDEEGNKKEPFLLCINMTSLGIRGGWNNEPRIIGLFHHFAGLEKQFKGGDPRKNPFFHFTTISLKKKTDGIKFQPHFSTEPASLLDMKEALKLWESLRPNKEIDTLDKSYISGYEDKRTDYSTFSNTEVVDEDDDEFKL